MRISLQQNYVSSQACDLIVRMLQFDWLSRPRLYDILATDPWLNPHGPVVPPVLPPVSTGENVVSVDGTLQLQQPSGIQALSEDIGIPHISSEPIESLAMTSYPISIGIAEAGTVDPWPLCEIDKGKASAVAAAIATDKASEVSAAQQGSVLQPTGRGLE